MQEDSETNTVNRNPTSTHLPPSTLKDNQDIDGSNHATGMKLSECLEPDEQSVTVEDIAPTPVVTLLPSSSQGGSKRTSRQPSSEKLPVESLEAALHDNSEGKAKLPSKTKNLLPPKDPTPPSSAKLTADGAKTDEESPMTLSNKGYIPGRQVADSKDKSPESSPRITSAESKPAPTEDDTATVDSSALHVDAATSLWNTTDQLLSGQQTSTSSQHDIDSTSLGRVEESGVPTTWETQPSTHSHLAEDSNQDSLVSEINNNNSNSCAEDSQVEQPNTPVVPAGLEKDIEAPFISTQPLIEQESLDPSALEHHRDVLEEGHEVFASVASLQSFEATFDAPPATIPGVNYAGGSNNDDEGEEGSLMVGFPEDSVVLNDTAEVSPVPPIAARDNAASGEGSVSSELFVESAVVDLANKPNHDPFPATENISNEDELYNQSTSVVSADDTGDGGSSWVSSAAEDAVEVQPSLLDGGGTTDNPDYPAITAALPLASTGLNISRPQTADVDSAESKPHSLGTPTALETDSRSNNHYHTLNPTGAVPPVHVQEPQPPASPSSPPTSSFSSTKTDAKTDADAEAQDEAVSASEEVVAADDAVHQREVDVVAEQCRQWEDARSEAASQKESVLGVEEEATKADDTVPVSAVTETSAVAPAEEKGESKELSLDTSTVDQSASDNKEEKEDRQEEKAVTSNEKEPKTIEEDGNKSAVGDQKLSLAKETGEVTAQALGSSPLAVSPTSDGSVPSAPSDDSPSKKKKGVRFSESNETFSFATVEPEEVVAKPRVGRFGALQRSTSDLSANKNTATASPTTDASSAVVPTTNPDNKSPEKEVSTAAVTAQAPAVDADVTSAATALAAVFLDPHAASTTTRNLAHHQSTNNLMSSPGSHHRPLHTAHSFADPRSAAVDYADKVSSTTTASTATTTAAAADSPKAASSSSGGSSLFAGKKKAVNLLRGYVLGAKSMDAKANSEIEVARIQALHEAGKLNALAMKEEAERKAVEEALLQSKRAEEEQKRLKALKKAEEEQMNRFGQAKSLGFHSFRVGLSRSEYEEMKARACFVRPLSPSSPPRPATAPSVTTSLATSSTDTHNSSSQPSLNEQPSPAHHPYRRGLDSRSDSHDPHSGASLQLSSSGSVNSPRTSNLNTGSSAGSPGGSNGMKRGTSQRRNSLLKMHLKPLTSEVAAAGGSPMHVKLSSSTDSPHHHNHQPPPQSSKSPTTTLITMLQSEELIARHFGWKDRHLVQQQLNADTTGTTKPVQELRTNSYSSSHYEEEAMAALGQGSYGGGGSGGGKRPISSNKSFFAKSLRTMRSASALTQPGAAGSSQQQAKRSNAADFIPAFDDAFHPRSIFEHYSGFVYHDPAKEYYQRPASAVFFEEYYKGHHHTTSAQQQGASTMTMPPTSATTATVPLLSQSMPTLMPHHHSHDTTATTSPGASAGTIGTHMNASGNMNNVTMMSKRYLKAGYMLNVYRPWGPERPEDALEEFVKRSLASASSASGSSTVASMDEDDESMSMANASYDSYDSYDSQQPPLAFDDDESVMSKTGVQEDHTAPDATSSSPTSVSKKNNGQLSQHGSVSSIPPTAASTASRSPQPSRMTSRSNSGDSPTIKAPSRASSTLSNNSRDNGGGRNSPSRPVAEQKLPENDGPRGKKKGTRKSGKSSKGDYSRQGSNGGSPTSPVGKTTRLHDRRSQSLSEGSSSMDNQGEDAKRGLDVEDATQELETGPEDNETAADTPNPYKRYRDESAGKESEDRPEDRKNDDDVKDANTLRLPSIKAPQQTLQHDRTDEDVVNDTDENAVGPDEPGKRHHHRRNHHRNHPKKHLHLENPHHPSDAQGQGVTVRPPLIINIIPQLMGFLPSVTTPRDNQGEGERSSSLFAAS